MSRTPLHGVIAEFATPEAMLSAARRLREAGFRRFDAYTPYPIEEFDALTGERDRWLPVFVLAVTVAGLLAGYSMQYWAAAVDYPLNIGGRPLNSWPAFAPIAFEIMVVWGVAGAFIGFFLFSRLPRLNHPVDFAPDFDRASRDRFFLCAEASDPLFDAERLRRILAEDRPERIEEVPA